MGKKKCSKCGEIKPNTLEYFYAKKSCADGLDAQCKECKKAASARWRKANPERKRELNLKWQQENRDKVRTSINKWGKNNRDKMRPYYSQWRKENREKCKTYYQKYRKNNREKVLISYRITSAKRRALQDNLPATFTADHWADSLVYFNNQCAYCGKSSRVLQFDHFIPHTKGGGFSPDNIVPACQCCNKRKMNQDFFEWYPQQTFYSKLRENKISAYLKLWHEGRFHEWKLLQPQSTESFSQEETVG